MTQQTINIGTAANDRKGDSLRAAFGKVNDNFTELYNNLGADGTPFNPLSVDTHLLPKTTNTYDIGSPTRQWRSMYVGLNTLYINNVPISLDQNGNLTVDGDPVQGGSGSGLQGDSAINVTVGSHPLVENVTIFAADTFGPGVWRLFVLDSAYPTLGTTVTAGATVTTAWGTPVTATVQTVIHDTGAGYWVFTFNQNVITGFQAGPKTATFGPGINTWTFGTDGQLTLPVNVAGNSVLLSTAGNVELYSNNETAQVKIRAKGGDGDSEWKFRNDGTLEFPAGYLLPNTLGSPGQVLTLGGQGSTSWETPSGGGGLSYIYNTNTSRYVITAYHRDTETEEYWVEVRGLDFFNEVDGLAGPNVTVMVRLLQDAPGVYRAISGLLDTTTTPNTTRINLADIADLNYVGSYITTVCRYLNKSQITNGDNIQLRLVDNRIEISNNTGRIYGVENSLILKADQDFAWSEDYGLELYYSFDNDTHLRPLSRKKGAALGFGYGSYGSHIRVEGSEGQQGQPNSGDRVVIYSSREQVSHVYTNGQDFSNEVTLTSPNVLIPGLSQRNQSEIEVNIFTDPNGELGGTLLGLSIGAKIEFTYNKIGAGRADIIGYVSQAFQTIAQGDPANPSRARISGRVNNQVPADYASIWQVNIPEANSNRSAEWVFGNDGSLLLPNHTKIGTYGMGWTGITNTTDQPNPISIASVSSNNSNRGTELSSIMVYGSGQNDLTGVVDFYTHDLLRNNHYNWTFTSDGRTKFPDDKIKSDNTHGLAIETNENPTAPPTHIGILGADFVAVNRTYTQNVLDPMTWIPAGYNPATDPYIQYDNGYGIWVPGFNQALYVNTGPLNTPYEQWDTNPPLGSIAPTGTYDYSDTYTHTWEFKNYGMLRFPGGGYLNVKAIPPAHSYGAEGDRIGMMAFDGDYIYYCVQNFEMVNVVGTTGSNHDHFDFGVNYGFNKINTDILGWTLVVPGQSSSVTVTNVDQNLNNGIQTGLSFSAGVEFTLTNTFTFVSPGGDIWKRVAWSNSSW